MKRTEKSSHLSAARKKRLKTSLSPSSSSRQRSPSFIRITPLPEDCIAQRVRIAHLERRQALADFQYSPLKEGTNEIRVLHVLRQSGQGTLRARLEHAPLDKALYETVSYCWSDPTPSRVLVVDGARLLIPESSWQALNRLAFDDKERTLWIDAVCINQQENDERGHQVALMREVYSHGIRNVVYLGEPANEELMVDAFATITALHVESQGDAVFQERLKVSMIINMRQSHSSIQTEFSETPIYAFFSNPWFSRLWVLQEICLAFENICVLGQSKLDFRVILEVAAWLRDYHASHISSELFYLPGLVGAVCALAAYMTYRRYQRLSLTGALEFGRDLEASDPRDKVYGLLGLVPEDLRELQTLRPDYRKSWQDVHADATREAIREAGGRVLGMISHRDEADIQGDGLPSWVPRLQRKFDFLFDASRFEYFGDWPEASARLGGSGKILELEGWTICLAKSVADGGAFQTSTYQVDVRWFDQVAAMAPSMANESLDMLARTLIADCNEQPLRSTAEERLWYLTLVELHADRIYVPTLAELSAIVNPSPELRKLAQFWNALIVAAFHRTFAISEEGHLLLVPQVTQPSDIVVYIEGCNFPLVLRPKEDHFFLLGECYIDGLMRWQEGFDEFYEKLEQTPKIAFEIH